MYQFLKNIPWFLQFFISKINKMLILNNRCDIVDNCVVYLLVYFFLYKVIHTIKSLQLQENVFFLLHLYTVTQGLQFACLRQEVIALPPSRLL